MTEPADRDGESAVDAVRDEEKAARDAALTAELAQTEEIADAVALDADGDAN